MLLAYTKINEKLTKSTNKLPIDHQKITKIKIKILQK